MEFDTAMDQALDDLLNGRKATTLASLVEHQPAAKSTDLMLGKITNLRESIVKWTAWLGLHRREIAEEAFETLARLPKQDSTNFKVIYEGVTNPNADYRGLIASKAAQLVLSVKGLYESLVLSNRELRKLADQDIDRAYWQNAKKLAEDAIEDLGYCGDLTERFLELTKDKDSEVSALAKIYDSISLTISDFRLAAGLVEHLTKVNQ